MTQDSQGSVALPSITDLLEKMAAHGMTLAALRPQNKAALFGALAAAGITTVTVAFDGYGDSGQIERIDAVAGDESVELPATTVDIATTWYGAERSECKPMLVGDAVEQLCYDWLEETHAGWENNEGAYGEFVFDVATQEITLEYYQRYETVHSFSHTF